MADAIRAIGVKEVTCYRWRSEYGDMKLDQMKRLSKLGWRMPGQAAGIRASHACSRTPNDPH
jgi:hypothetical protein